MSEKPAAPAPQDRALRRAHRGTLGLLVACAIGIGARGFEGPEPPPDRLIGSLAVALALGSIVARRLGTSPVIGARAATAASLVSFALIGALGLLGVHLAWNFSAPETGLLVTLGGAIFALRPAAPAGVR